MRFTLDRSARRLDGGRMLVAGSPLTLFRLGPAGQVVLDRIERGEDVPVAAQSLLDRLLDTGSAHPRPTRSTTTMTPADVTVVIPVHGHDPAQAAGAVGDVASVIVVDDASQPPATRPGGAHLIRHGTNLGPGAARMTGLSEVETPLVAFVDADCIPDAGWLEPLLAHFDDPRVAAAAPRVRSSDGRSVLAAYEALRSPLDLGPVVARVAPGTRVAYVPATALVARAKALRDAGGFDRALRTGEDVDLVWRLVERGWRVRYEPESVVRHAPRGALRELLRQRAGYGRSATPLHQRHPGAVAPAVVGVWPASGWALAALGHPFVGAAVGALPAVALARTLPPAGGRIGLVARLTAWGLVRAGEQLASALSRVWWPVALLGAVAVPRLRRSLLLAVIIPAAIDWARATGQTRLDPARYLALRLLDDAAYGYGVWAGALTARDPGALLPRVSRSHVPRTYRPRRHPTPSNG